MQAYHNSAVLQFDDQTTGNAGVGVPVTVRINSTQALASIFDLDEVATGNPTATDSKGNYAFKVADGVYDIIISEGTGNEVVLEKVQISEFAGPINDLSQAYEFPTVAAYKAFTTAFPVGKTITLLDRGADFTVISGTGTATENKIIASDQVSQSIDLIVEGVFFSSQICRFSDGVGDDTVGLNEALALVASGKKLIIDAKHLHAENLSCVTSGVVDIECVGDGEIITSDAMTDQVALWVSHLPYLQDITQYYDPANRAGGTSLSVNASRLDRTITVDDGSIFTAGEYIYIISTNDWLASASIKKGENRKINSITGNVITLDGGIDDDYFFSGTTCYPYKPPVVNIKSLKMSGADDENDLIGLHLYECASVNLDHPTVTGYNLRDIQLYFVAGGLISNPNNDFSDKSYVSGGRSSYSLVLNGSRDLSVRDGALRGGRHSFSTGGYIPNRNIRVNDVVVYSSDPFDNDVAAFDTHEGTINFKAKGCTVYGAMNCAGADLDISDNEVYVSGELLRAIELRAYKTCSYMKTDNNTVYATDCVGGIVIRPAADNVLIGKVSQNNNNVIMTTAFNRPAIGLEPNGVSGSQIRLLDQSRNNVDVRGSAINAIGIGNYDVGDLVNLISILHTTCKDNVVYNESGPAIDYYCADKNNGVIDGNRFETDSPTARAINLRNFTELDYDNNHAIMSLAALAANSANLFRDIDKLNILNGSMTNSYYNGVRLLNVTELNQINLELINCVVNDSDVQRTNAKFIFNSWALVDGATGSSVDSYHLTSSRLGAGNYRLTFPTRQVSASSFPVIVSPESDIGWSITRVNFNAFDVNFTGNVDTDFSVFVV